MQIVRRPYIAESVFGMLILLAFVGLGWRSASASPASSQGSSQISGRVVVIKGQTEPGDDAPSPVIMLLNPDGSGPMLLPDFAGALTMTDLTVLDDHLVIVTGRFSPAGQETVSGRSTFLARSVEVISEPVRPDGQGGDGGDGGAPLASRWVTIGCKFSDVAAEPKPISYLNGMYRATFPGLADYWRTASYGLLDLTGSNAIGWYTLPLPKSSYMTDATYPNFDAIVRDCAAAADPVVNFADYTGIQFALNDSIGCCAWGGRPSLSLDGVQRVFSVTWLPSWAYATMAVVQHEMGHAYGLPGSSASDGGGHNNPWDVMGSSRYNCAALSDPTYSCIGQHTLAYQRDRLGWLVPAQKVAATLREQTILLDFADALPAAGAYTVATVPIDGAADHFYTVEARRLSGYDVKLPGQAVVIHEVDLARGEPAWLVDRKTDPDGTDNGQMWTPGEMYAAPEGGIVVRVNRATAAGFEVTIYNGLPVKVVQVTPTQDTYVTSAATTTAYGSAPTLNLKAASPSEEAYLKFDLSGLPPSATEATLRLTLDLDGKQHPEVYSASPNLAGTTTPWTGSTLTWSKAPGMGRLLDSVPTTVSTTAVEWDLSGSVTSGREYTFGLRSPAGATARTRYASAEGATAPQLVVAYWDVPGYSEPPPPPPPPPLTFRATDDTYVASAYPTKSYGTATALRVKNASADFNAYLKFNVTGLTLPVAKATLRLYNTDAGPDGGSVYTVSDVYPGTSTPWTEAGLKWNNAPAISGTPVVALGAVTVNRWVEVDVTQAITGNGVFSLAVRSASTNLVVYGSDESAHPPELVVEVAP